MIRLSSNPDFCRWIDSYIFSDSVFHELSNGDLEIDVSSKLYPLCTILTWMVEKRMLKRGTECEALVMASSKLYQWKARKEINKVTPNTVSCDARFSCLNLVSQLEITNFIVID